MEKPTHVNIKVPQKIKSQIQKEAEELGMNITAFILHLFANYNDPFAVARATVKKDEGKKPTIIPIPFPKYLIK